MNTVYKPARVLGMAFLLQAVTSLISEAFVLQPLIVSGNISESMRHIAANPGLMWANILGQMITALGIVFLGAMLFITLRKQNETMALVALGFYILEAALLAVSRIDAFALLRLSQEYVTAGQSAYVQLMGNLAFESMSYGLTLHMLPCCLGVVLFYYLLDKARIVPRVLSLWGLIAILPFLIGAPLAIVGYQVPVAFYLPYVPFEFVIGLWILIKGIKVDAETAQVRHMSPAGANA